VAYDGYGTLVLSEGSASVLSGGRKVEMRKDPERSARTARSSSSARRAVIDLAPDAQPIFEELREWRAAEAKEQGVPAYVVFNDASLRELATVRPTTLEGLAGITGVGEAKLERYGAKLLEVLTS
jgi:ATP-dependent DNA helicase RecQ